jgi:hypothetical protein
VPWGIALQFNGKGLLIGALYAAHLDLAIAGDDVVLAFDANLIRSIRSVYRGRVGEWWKA